MVNIKSMVNGLVLWRILVDRGLPMKDPWDMVYLPRFTPTTINMSPSFFRGHVSFRGNSGFLLGKCR